MFSLFPIRLLSFVINLVKSLVGISCMFSAVYCLFVRLLFIFMNILFIEGPISCQRHVVACFLQQESQLIDTSKDN